MPKFVQFLFIGAFLIALPLTVWAESSSTNFILWGDAQTGGGNRSTSSNYILYGSAADLSNQALDSANYHLAVGFQAIYEEPLITVQISSTSETLSPDPLTTGSVSTATTTVTVSTNADFGYALSLTEAVEIQNQSAINIDDVIDGSVTAGSEEFGVAVSGADAAFGDDQAVSATPLTIASRSIWGADRQTTITFKAAISDTTAAGSYSGDYSIIGTSQY